MHLPEPELLFTRFQQTEGTVAGARAAFELFVLDLVDVDHPGLATTVAGAGGRDWGIDVLVGTFTSGKLAVWQCKFILEWQDKGPQGEIRASFKSAREKAEENKEKIGAWTLVVPCVLAPDQQRWFDAWAKRQLRDYGIKVELLNGTKLRGKLIRPDARHVRREYFPEYATGQPLDVEGVAETDDLSLYDSALFVRQLHEAGETETDPARGLYYATDALVRDYEAKGDRAAMEALKELHLDVHQVWGAAFNAAHATPEADGMLPNLHPAVMEAAGNRPDPHGLALRPVHKKGAVHRLVEDGRAGWVSQWRKIATEHRAQGAPITAGTDPVAISEPDEPGEGSGSPELGPAGVTAASTDHEVGKEEG